jgi:hypothetical protein
MSTLIRHTKLREAEGVFRKRLWEWPAETFRGSTNFQEEGDINLQAKIIEDQGARWTLVLKVPCLIKLGMVTCLEDAGHEIEILNILVSA